jgi:dipeptidyl aminopeptidase/acylaminoacyl peptidase
LAIPDLRARHFGDGKRADTTVDESASVAIADALRALGKDVTLYLYEGSGHALQGGAYNRYAERTLAFFRMHLGA